MATEFKLSYTASDINERLGRIDNLAKKSDIPSKLSELTNDSGFATESYVNSAIANIDIPEVDLKDYALKSEIPTDYLKSIPSEYVTETELTAKGYLTEHQSLTGYATESYVNEGLATKQPIGDYALKSEIPDVSSAIIDVTKLPAENIREDVFYRLPTGQFVYNQFIQDTWTCHIVDDLPEVGEPVTSDMVNIVAYYDVPTNDVYGYINDILASQAGVPTGWYTLSTLAPVFDVEWGGIITSVLEDPEDDAFRLLLEYTKYSYKDGWTNDKKIGNPGTGPVAEVFNHPSNIASGEASHAEGYASHAEGHRSHAEGHRSHAEGYASHAEGDYSHAEGDHSHAEGDASHAEGYASHAEGYVSHAEGHSSHAEGYYSHAEGRSQHVQGEFNIIDPEYNANTPHVRAKYAHIVGNGTGEANRSNAHTLDWSGNGWFAGDVFVGGSGQDDDAAERLAKMSDIPKDKIYIAAINSTTYAEIKMAIDNGMICVAKRYDSNHIYYVGEASTDYIRFFNLAHHGGECYYYLATVFTNDTWENSMLSPIKLATENYVNTAVASLVNSAPEALNTLDELAAALGDDSNFATTVTNQIAAKQDAITGTAGQFVVIGTNGKPTTKTILIAEEATF